jgi:glycosyltransferase involved in cell wall biosynthesis
MKIVHAVYSLEMGGAEVLVGQLCRIQRAQGHEPSVVAYSKLGVIGETLRAEGFSITVLGEAHPLITMKRYFAMFTASPPDVVHCHNVAPTIHAAFSARLAGVARVISTRHRFELFPYDRANEAKYNVMGWFCDWVVGICEVTCINIRSGPLAWKDNVVRVYNGAAKIERERLEGTLKRGFTLVYVGRLVREKDIETLIRSVVLAKERVAEIVCWIVGDGSVRAELEALTQALGLEKDICFWGQQKDVAPFLSTADLFVMSSISEGLPMSLLQAMSVGLPAVLTDVDGMGEILRLTGGGLLVPIRNPAAMADAIVRLALDETLRSTLAQRSLTGYEEGFTLDKMNAAYMALYKS